MERTPNIILASPDASSGQPRWFIFRDLVEIRQTRCSHDVIPHLRALEQAADSGLHVAGFLAYEAAAGLDPALAVHPNPPCPLLWFGVFRKKEPFEFPTPDSAEPCDPVENWGPALCFPEYESAFRRIKQYIAQGHTYQVNYTYRTETQFTGDPWSMFAKLYRAQPAPYSAFVDTGELAICSVSPELFFRLDGTQLIACPMKGTARRGLTLAQDQAQRDWLANSEKNLAENTMIVDMIRNDMGRVAKPAGVRVTSLFDIHRLPTAFQMTSTVTAETSAPFHQIIQALFPCASVTGAPKVRTMQIIRELESTPRGIYTGCIGYLSPERQSQFNVAIRTVTIDRSANRAHYGVGGGIVWDSEVNEEYAECRTKTLFLTTKQPEFQLLETILWQGQNGYFLLPRHLARLADSAEYFEFPVDLNLVKDRLDQAGRQMGDEPRRVRLLVDRKGEIRIETAIMSPPAPSPWRLGLATQPIDPDNPFLYHKTTNRKVYDSARTASEVYDDIVLWNTKNQITETRIGNIVIEKDGRLFTPPVECGLLPGVFRADLLARGILIEKIITPHDLLQADKIFVINSVRKWLDATMDKDSPSPPP